MVIGHRRYIHVNISKNFSQGTSTHLISVYPPGKLLNVGPTKVCCESNTSKAN